MKQIALRFCIIALCMVWSCKQNEPQSLQEASVTTEEVSKQVPEKIENALAFNEPLDSLSVEEKEAKLKEASVDGVDAYCPVCNRRCCSPCFARAGRNCASLKFENCSVCNHSSNGHYAVAH